MPVLIEEQKNSRQWTKSVTTGLSVTRVWIVHAKQDEALSYIDTQEGIRLGTTYTGFNTLTIKELSTAFYTHNTSLVTASYTNKGEAGSQTSQTGPRLNDKIATYNSEMESSQEYTDRNGKMLNPVGQPVTVARPRLTARITHYRATFPLGDFMALVGRVNDRSWNGGNAGTWLYTGFSGSKYNEDMYQLDHTFSFAPEGHQKTTYFMQATTTTANNGKQFTCQKAYPFKNPQEIVSELYQTGNLALLGV